MSREIFETVQIQHNDVPIVSKHITLLAGIFPKFLGGGGGGGGVG